MMVLNLDLKAVKVRASHPVVVVVLLQLCGA